MTYTPQKEQIDGVRFQAVSGNTLWFQFWGGRVRRLPVSQVYYFRQQVAEPQSIVVSVELADELRRANLI